MSLIHEIHSQKPAVRYTLFALSAVVVLSVVGFFGITSFQRVAFMALHSDPQEQADFLAQQDAQQPQIFDAIARAASSLTASIGSLVGWDTNAGFDRSGRAADTTGSVHLLPLSQ
jgi:hypothetical protein